MKVRLIGILVAVVLAVVGLVALTLYVQGADRRAQEAAELLDVYVVEEPVPAGTPVERLGEFLRVEGVPRAALAPDLVTDLSEIAGLVTADPLYPGDQLIASRLVDPLALQQAGTVPVPDGLQEVTVQLGPDRVVGGRIVAGDRVGILISYENYPPEGGAATRLVYQQVLVTSVQGAPVETVGGAAPEVPVGALLVSFAVNGPEAERIVFAAQFGSLWLSKQSDTTDPNGTGVTRMEGILG